MGPPSCSLRPPLLPFEGLFLREDEAFFMMVLFPHIYSKHHAVLMFNMLHVPMVTSLNVCNAPILNTEVTVRYLNLARYFPKNPRTSKIIVRSEVKILKLF